MFLKSGRFFKYSGFTQNSGFVIIAYIILPQSCLKPSSQAISKTDNFLMCKIYTYVNRFQNFASPVPSLNKLWLTTSAFEVVLSCKCTLKLNWKSILLISSKILSFELRALMLRRLRF